MFCMKHNLRSINLQNISSYEAFDQLYMLFWQVTIGIPNKRILIHVYGLHFIETLLFIKLITCLFDIKYIIKAKSYLVFIVIF